MGSNRAHITRRGALAAGVAASGALLAPAGMAAAAAAASPPMERSARLRLRLDEGWLFHLGHASDEARDFGFGRFQRTFAKQGAFTATAAGADLDTGDWQAVRVPHDWAVDLPFVEPSKTLPEGLNDAAAAHGFKAIGRNFPHNSVGWYRRVLPAEVALPGKRAWLEFDGVFRDSLVFVNGYIVAHEESGYAPFVVDITDFLNDDAKPNLLALRVDASLGEGWFYEGAGIYRDVHLIVADAVHVPAWGIQIIAAPKAAGATVTARCEVANTALAPRAPVLRQWLVGPSGDVVARADEHPLRLAAEEGASIDVSFALASAALWSVEAPALYTHVAELVVDGAVVDHHETPFGIRTVMFDAERGFLLNGKPVKLKGVCNHQDHAGVGAAIPPALDAWRVARMQAMGANAWRSAHNPPSAALLDVCDARGMLMVNEMRLNTTSAQAIDQLRRIVRRDRNHPSIIAWSVGNEEPHQGTARGARISAEMIRELKRLDATRPTTQAFDNGFGLGASLVVDVVGFNYRTDKMAAFHERFPDRPIMGTETGSTVSTRGEYANDAGRHIVRAYDTEHPWWATTAEAWWSIVADAPYVAGGFIWTGFDYRGEPTPYGKWPSVSSYFGVADLCGFPKDNFYYYQAWWRRDKPLVHLFPHWNWAGREGQPIEIWAHSNADAVELIVNGRSAGRKAVAPNRHVAWMVPYAPGRIEVRGYRGGRVIARDVRETTGAPVALALAADRPRFAGDGRDVAVVTVSALDAGARAVPVADTAFEVVLTGPGRVIGIGNGDPLSRNLARDHGQLFNGLAQLLVQASGPGAIGVAVRGAAARPARLLLTAT